MEMEIHYSCICPQSWIYRYPKLFLVFYLDIRDPNLECLAHITLLPIELFSQPKFSSTLVFWIEDKDENILS